MNADLQTRIDRAKELLATCRHAAMATVNADGTPHNTPFLFMRDEALEHIFWGSHPGSQHTQNILRTGKLFVVLYDAIQRGGLYIAATNGHEVVGEELAAALAAHNKIRTKENKEPLSVEYYSGNSPQRMYMATVTNLWVNNSERNASGALIKDSRQEVTATDLLH